MPCDLMRFSVAMPEDLLIRFDALVAKRGLAKNRSEVIRDLVREALINEECSLPGQTVMGTLTIVFNHHASDVREKLDHIAHESYSMIVSSLHVHLDQDECMETIILKGESSEVQALAHRLLGTKGVSHGQLAMTAISPHIYSNEEIATLRAWGQNHPCISESSLNDALFTDSAHEHIH